MIRFDAEDDASVTLERLPSGYVRIAAHATIDQRGVLLGPMTAQALAAVLATLGTRAGQ